MLTAGLIQLVATWLDLLIARLCGACMPCVTVSITDRACLLQNDVLLGMVPAQLGAMPAPQLPPPPALPSTSSVDSGSGLVPSAARSFQNSLVMLMPLLIALCL